MIGGDMFIDHVYSLSEILVLGTIGMTHKNKTKKN